jgi:hypothetical protein
MYQGSNGSRHKCGLNYLLNFSNLRNKFPQTTLNAHSQSHRRAGARPTSALQTQLNDGTVNLNQFYIAAIRQQIGAQSSRTCSTFWEVSASVSIGYLFKLVVS